MVHHFDADGNTNAEKLCSFFYLKRIRHKISTSITTSGIFGHFYIILNKDPTYPRNLDDMSIRLGRSLSLNPVNFEDLANTGYQSL